MKNEKELVSITICKGDEYRSKQNDIYETSDIFYESYCSAAVNLEEILRTSKSFLKELKPSFNKPAYDKSPAALGDSLLGYTNNIIAFCADRGHGKTSAMISFSSALSKEMGPQKGAEKERGAWEDGRKRFWENAAGKGTGGEELVLNTVFWVLKYVDPTMIEESDSILRVLLVRLFNSLQKWWESEGLSRQGNRWADRSDAAQEYEELLDLFQKALHTVKLLLSKRVFDDSGDELDQIIDQGDVSNLRGLLYSLIHRYLKLVTGTEESVLVVQIDDADLNTEKAYRIVEDIRRYLFMPQLVVLMAMNLNQMESVVEQHFLQEFQTSLTQHGMIDTAACHDMAERYLDKTLPGSRLIHLKNMDDQLRDGYNRLQIYYYPDQKNKENLLPGGAGSDMTYQQQLLGLLHRKTGLVFLEPEYLHDFLPHTMRELTHFLAFFEPMQDIPAGSGYASMLLESEGNSRQIWLGNVRKLKHYLLHVWAPLNLREEEKRFLHQLAVDGDVNRNLEVLKFLPEYYGQRMARGVTKGEAAEHRKAYLKRCEERQIYIETLLDRKWATYANVCEALKLLSEMPGGSDFYRFIYAIRLSYSIRLHELMLTGEDLEKRWSRVELILCNTLFHPERVRVETKYGSMRTVPQGLADLQSLLKDTNNRDIENMLYSYYKKVVFSDGELKHRVYELIEPSTDSQAETDPTEEQAGTASTGNQAAADSTDDQAAADSTDDQAAADSTDDQAAADSIDDQAAADSTGNQAAADSTDDQAMLVFDPFLPLHNSLNNCKGNIPSSREDMATRLQNEDALLILLNWDVQYLILRGVEARLDHNLQGWMRNNHDALNQLFRKNKQIPLFAQRDITVFIGRNNSRILCLMDLLTDPSSCYVQMRQSLETAANTTDVAKKTDAISANIELFQTIGFEMSSSKSNDSGSTQSENPESDKISNQDGDSDLGRGVDKNSSFAQIQAIAQEIDSTQFSGWFGNIKEIDFAQKEFEKDNLAALIKARDWWNGRWNDLLKESIPTAQND